MGGKVMRERERLPTYTQLPGPNVCYDAGLTRGNYRISCLFDNTVILCCHAHLLGIDFGLSWSRFYLFLWFTFKDFCTDIMWAFYVA